MRRRRLLQGGAVAGTWFMAGCIVGELGEPSVELIDIDTDEVREPDTMEMIATVENDGDEPIDVQLVGEISIDETDHVTRRNVSVPGGEHTYHLKNRYPAGLFDVFFYDAEVIDDPEEPPDGDAGYHDLYVVGIEEPSEASIERGSATVTSRVANRADPERTATLVTTFKLDGENYEEDREVAIPGGEIDEIGVAVNHPAPEFVYTYNYWSQIV